MFIAYDIAYVIGTEERMEEYLQHTRPRFKVHMWDEVRWGEVR